MQLHQHNCQGVFPKCLSIKVSKITWMLRKVAYHSIISAWESQQRYLKVHQMEEI